MTNSINISLYCSSKLWGQVFDFGFHINKLTKTSKIAQLNNAEITPCLSGETGVYDVECERSLLNNALIKL